MHQVTGHWGFPKGHVEQNETEEQTAIREVKEETNIDVKINTKYRYSMKYSPKEDVMKEVIFFVATNITEDAKPQEEEVSEIKWFNFEDALSILTFENTKELLCKIKEDLKI